MGTGKLLLGLLEALEKKKTKAIKTLLGRTNNQIVLKDLNARKVFPCSCNKKLRFIQALLLGGDLGELLGQCCHSSWEGKGVLLFFGEGLEGFRLRNLSWGRESKNLHY